MVQRSRAQRLNGLFPLSYTGVIPVSPVNFVMDDRPPTINDSKNFYIGDLWLDTTTTPPDVADLWMLVSLAGHNATWVNFGAGDLETLTGNSGGPVSPNPAGNINVVGDGTTINVAGNPGTNTLTISAIAGAALVETLTGNSGGPVSPTLGNINVVGTGVITVVGNPGTSTLTVTPSGSIASSFITNPATGTATPVAGVLTFAGTGSVTVSAAGSTVTINGGASGTVTGLLAQDGHTVTPTANVIQVSGAQGITTTGTVGPNTLTIHPPASAVNFSAYVSANINNVIGLNASYTILFDTVVYDSGSNYNAGTGVFTAPVAGIYQFNYGVSLGNIAIADNCSLVIRSTPLNYQLVLGDISAYKDTNNVVGDAGSTTLKLSMGDTVHMTVAAGGEAGNTIGIEVTHLTEGFGTYFSGYRIS